MYTSNHPAVKAVEPPPSIPDLIAKARAVIQATDAYPLIYRALHDTKRYDDLTRFFAEFDAATNAFEQQAVTADWQAKL